MKSEDWLEQYKEKTICTDGEFGHNCEFNFLPKFKKLSNMGVDLKIEDYYTLKIKFMPDTMIAKEVVFLFVLTELPGCSQVKWSVAKQTLTLEWHN